MKVCPKCGHVYSDETQSFCLMDGTQLVAGNSVPTIASPVSQPTEVVLPRKKRGPGLWILLGLVLLIAAGVIVGALMFAAYRMGESAKDIRVNVATSPTPRTSVKTQSTPAISPPVSVSVEKTPQSSPVESIPTDEITPITWTTAATTFSQDMGRTYRFSCPAGGTPGAVWGSDVYTADSSICTAAVHAGIITLKDGGDVTIEFGPGRQTYGATTRNGITSYNFGQYPHSITLR